MPNLSDLNWQPVLLVKVTREPFTGMFCGLQVSRLHLALHPDGVVCAAWDVPLELRKYPRVRLVGWRPLRDVPFNLPVRFERKREARSLSLIPNGTWVIPYNDEQYSLYLHLQQRWQSLMAYVDAGPYSPFTLNLVRSLITTTPYSSNLN